MSDITARLHEAVATGLDMSPGDPLAHEAYIEIVKLRNKLKICIHGYDICPISDKDCIACLRGNNVFINL